MEKMLVNKIHIFPKNSGKEYLWLSNLCIENERVDKKEPANRLLTCSSMQDTRKRAKDSIFSSRVYYV